MQYISKQLLLYLCEGKERTPGAHAGMRWWDQADIGLEGARDGGGGKGRQVRYGGATEGTKKEDSRAGHWYRIQIANLTN